MRDRHQEPDDLAMPHFEDELWNELDVLVAEGPTARDDAGPRHRRRSPGRGRRGGDRRPIVVAGTGLVAAATLVVVALAWPGPDDGASPGQVQTIDLSDPQVVVARVLQATEPGADEPSVLHTTESYGEGIDRTETWYDDVTFARRERTTTAAGDPLTDNGWAEPPALDAPPAQPRSPEDPDFDQCVGGILMTEDGELQPCDTGEPVDTGLPPGHPGVAVNHCSRTYARTEQPVLQQPGFDYLRLYLETGGIVVDGTGEHDGRQLIRLRNHDASYTWLVDPDTYEPVVATEEATGSARVTMTYERLPRTEENLALLSPPVPDDYTDASGEDLLQEAIENPCAERPSTDAEVVGVDLPEDLEAEACASLDHGDDPLIDIIAEADEDLAEQARREGLVLQCDGGGGSIVVSPDALVDGVNGQHR